MGSAFISGMEEGLNITSLQYNWMGVLSMIGYLSQIPSNILLSKNYLPDYPHNTPWLNQSESDLAVHRMGIDNTMEGKRVTASRRIEKIQSLLKNNIVAKKVGFDAVAANLLTTPDTTITMIFGLWNGFMSDG
ncbi:hypothetical protein V8B55DRAFT_1438299 [Mucor lusitanicus]